ncbi:MAG: hypothetical protein ACRC8Y_00565 [Chroococcales cyanobacterium]
MTNHLGLLYEQRQPVNFPVCSNDFSRYPGSHEPGYKPGERND